MNSRLLDRNLHSSASNSNSSNLRNSSTRKFKEHRLYKSIEDAGKKHKSRFNMTFGYRDLLKIVENLPVTREFEDILTKAFKNAESNVDKRPMNKQRQVRDKWQPTHGLVFKNIPENIPRQVIYTAITNLGQMRRDNGDLLFQGSLKIRNFNWPNRCTNGLRNIFPVFVSSKDRETLFKWATCQDYHIKLELQNHPDHPEYDVETDPWDGVLLVELPRSHETGEFHNAQSYKNSSIHGNPINIIDDEVPPQRTKPAEFYGAMTPPTQNLPNAPLLPKPQQPQQQQLPPTTINSNFQPVDINSFSLPITPPLMYPSGASSPMSMSSDMMMNYMVQSGNLSPTNLSPTTMFPPGLQNLQNFSSNNSSPMGPYGHNNNAFPLEIQQQNMTQQFSQLSTAKEEQDVFREALGRVTEIEQAKSHFSEKNSKEEEDNHKEKEKENGDENVNKKQDSDDGNSTPISDKLASDEMD